MIDHPPVGKGFDFYDWGGYLIGKGVPAKLFVDGRMHLWEKDGYSAFGDYLDIEFNVDKEKLAKYDFDWILVPSNSTFIDTLEKSDDMGVWKVEYRDSQAIYLVRQR